MQERNPFGQPTACKDNNNNNIMAGPFAHGFVI